MCEGDRCTQPEKIDAGTSTAEIEKIVTEIVKKMSF